MSTFPIGTNFEIKEIEGKNVLFAIHTYRKMFFMRDAEFFTVSVPLGIVKQNSTKDIKYKIRVEEEGIKQILIVEFFDIDFIEEFHA